MVLELVGFVTSVHLDKTISVLIPFKARNPRYPSDALKSKRVLVHDERQEAEIGDCVLVEAVQKYSKRKTWQLVKILPTKQSVVFLPEESLN